LSSPDCHHFLFLQVFFLRGHGFYRSLRPGGEGCIDPQSRVLNYFIVIKAIIIIVPDSISPARARRIQLLVLRSVRKNDLMVLVAESCPGPV